MRAGRAALYRHRTSIRMNFPYAAAKKTDVKATNAAMPLQILLVASSGDRSDGSTTVHAVA